MRTKFIVALVAMTSGQSEAVRLNAKAEQIGTSDAMNMFSGLASTIGNATGIPEIGTAGAGITTVANSALKGNINGAVAGGLTAVSEVTPGVAGEVIGATAQPMGASVDQLANGQYKEGVGSMFQATDNALQVLPTGGSQVTTPLPSNVIQPTGVTTQSSTGIQPVGGQLPTLDSQKQAADLAAAQATANFNSAEQMKAQALADLQAANQLKQQVEALEAQQAQQAQQALQAQQAAQAQQAQQALQDQQAQLQAQQALQAQQQAQTDQLAAQAAAAQQQTAVSQQQIQANTANQVAANMQDLSGTNQTQGGNQEIVVAGQEAQNQQPGLNAATGLLQGATAHMPVQLPGAATTMVGLIPGF